MCVNSTAESLHLHAWCSVSMGEAAGQILLEPTHIFFALNPLKKKKTKKKHTVQNFTAESGQCTTTGNLSISTAIQNK